MRLHDTRAGVDCGQHCIPLSNLPNERFQRHLCHMLSDRRAWGTLSFFCFNRTTLGSRFEGNQFVKSGPDRLLLRISYLFLNSPLPRGQQRFNFDTLQTNVWNMWKLDVATVSYFTHGNICICDLVGNYYILLFDYYPWIWPSSHTTLSLIWKQTVKPWWTCVWFSWIWCFCMEC